MIEHRKISKSCSTVMYMGSVGHQDNVDVVGDLQSYPRSLIGQSSHYILQFNSYR